MAVSKVWHHGKTGVFVFRKVNAVSVALVDTGIDIQTLSGSNSANSDSVYFFCNGNYR